MLSSEPTPKRCAARAYLLRGRVQGAGVRPAVARWASACELQGTIRNSRNGLLLELEGSLDVLDRFTAGLPSQMPSGCELEAIEVRSLDLAARVGLQILTDDQSEPVSFGPLATSVPLDRAWCETCQLESRDVADRRYRYPFITCAQCGPRFSILDRMPFERTSTTMAKFTMCRHCEQEYSSPKDRRFHAQVMSCPDCGPQLWATSGDQSVLARGLEALDIAIRALRHGQIVALKGIGGYQLLCDGLNDHAVRRLRTRKQRNSKPFATLMADVNQSRHYTSLSSDEVDVLQSAANPIVLVASRSDHRLAASVHPGLRDVGILLPSSGLHARLVEGAGVPLVCTSGNLADGAIPFRVEQSESELAGIADVWLHHDREIAHPVDDSVVRVIAGRRVTLRAARGIAPVTLEFPMTKPCLAVGGHLKSAFALNNGPQAVLSTHVGDLGTLEVRERYVARLEAWLVLYACDPTLCLHDLHPDYFTTRFAMSRKWQTIPVQHHRAHVGAGVLEHQLWGEPLLGFAWDGTGWGEDQTIWGGEAFAMDANGSLARVASWRPFALPGGELAVREPWRIAAGVLQQALPRHELASVRERFAERPVANLLHWLETSPLSLLQTTSVGRLFDAAAACILAVDSVQFEGQAAMYLEAAADRSALGCYSVTCSGGSDNVVAGRESNRSLGQLDWRPLFRELWRDLIRGEAPGTVSMRFHRAMAQGLLSIAGQFSRVPVVLQGGVFQNRLLCETILEMAAEPNRFKLPGRIPPNDGGLAAGQLAWAAMSLHRTGER